MIQEEIKEESKVDGVKSVLEPFSANDLVPPVEEPNNISPQKELEPDSNFPHSVFIDQKDDSSGEIGEQWIQETLFDIEAPTSKLVDYYLLNSRIFCIFEDRTVK